MKFIDWQLSWNGPPINDFSYFFYSNASIEAYRHFDVYKEIYYESLTEQLTVHNLKTEREYPREAFEKQMKTYAKFGMTMAFLIFYIRLFKNEIGDHEDLETSDENLFDQFKDDKDMSNYYALTNPLIRHCYERGFI